MEKLEKRIGRLVSRLRSRDRRPAQKDCDIITTVYTPSRRSTSSEVRPLTFESDINNVENEKILKTGKEEPSNQKLLELSQKAMIRMIEMGQKTNLQVSKKNPLGGIPSKLKKKLTRERIEVDVKPIETPILPTPDLVKRETETIEVTLDIHESYIDDEEASPSPNGILTTSTCPELEIQRIREALLCLDETPEDSYILIEDYEDETSPKRPKTASSDFMEIQYVESEIDRLPMIDDFQEVEPNSFRSHNSVQTQVDMLPNLVKNRNTQSMTSLPLYDRPDYATNYPKKLRQNDDIQASVASSEATEMTESISELIATPLDVTQDFDDPTDTEDQNQLSSEASDDVTTTLEVISEDKKEEKAMSETSTDRTSSIEIDELDDSLSTAPLPRLKIEDDDERRQDLESRESGYISSLSLASPNNSYSYSTQNLSLMSPKLSVRGRRYRQTHEEGIRMKGIQRATTTENLTEASSQTRDEAIFHTFMKNTVYKTKYITSIFEVKNGGMEDVVDDILWEIHKNINSNKMLVAACELHFSVPVERRNRKTEYRLKTGLLSTLRINNQRLLNLRRGSHQPPIQLFESNTDENIRLNRDVKAMQGIYLRVYKKLLDYAHKETTELHRPYWELSSNPKDDGLSPQPQKFLFDDGQKMDNLATDTLVAVNIIALAFMGLN